MTLPRKKGLSTKSSQNRSKTYHKIKEIEKDVVKFCEVFMNKLNVQRRTRSASKSSTAPIQPSAITALKITSAAEVKSSLGRRREKTPSKAVKILESWASKHLQYPYPTVTKTQITNS